MNWIGVTGGMGCGKSTVMNHFKKLGFGVVSADEIVHDLYQSPEVINEVSKILNIEKKEFSKARVAELVFSDQSKLRLIESYLHPLVRTEVLKKKEAFEKAGKSLVFYEVPLLFEKNMQENFDYTICVGADEKSQRARIKKRNTWSDEETEKRLASQMPLSQKKEMADFYIENSTSLKDLETACDELISLLKKNV